MTEKQPIGDLLDEIINKIGAYSTDERKYMDNVIQNASKNAAEVKARLIESLGSLLYEAVRGNVDIDQGISALLESINPPKKEA